MCVPDVLASTSSEKQGKSARLAKGFGVLLLFVLLPFILPIATMGLLVVGLLLLVRKILRISPYN